MTILDGAILGVVQGLTEFIPVSSSGHLVLVHELMGGASTLNLSFDAVLQLATVLAVLVYFWKDLIQLFQNFLRLLLRKPVEEKEKVLLYAIIVGTIPAFVLGLLLESKMETVFRSANLVAAALLVGSAIMLIAERFAKQNQSLEIRKGLKIGLFQALALIPGISRSGATISGGLLFGLTRIEATRFSFLLSFPIILGSGLKKLYDLLSMGTLEGISLSLGISFITAFAVGLWAIGFLIKYLKNHSLNIFVWYRVALAALILFFL